MEEFFIFPLDFFCIPVRVVRLHELDHPNPGQEAILGAESGEVPAVEEAIQSGDNGEEAHDDFLRKRPAQAPAKPPKISVRRTARIPPPTNSR